jgi:uncharacterized iron-regulated membrane protein
MKQPIRTILFWAHLAAGLAAGLVVAGSGLTGAAMAFEPQLLALVERSVCQSAGSTRLTLDDLLARVRAGRPGVRPSAVTIDRDPGSCVRVSLGRQDSVQVHPFTGELRAVPGQGWRDFLKMMIEWHRWLGTGGAGRAVGRAITGAASASFLFLCLSGLWLWWPRRWTRRALRQSLWFRRGLTGKARDWSWHNVIGFWSLPVLIVITSSGLVMSYRWATRLVLAVAGEAASPAAAQVVRAPGGRAAGLEVLLAAAIREVPGWRSVVLRLSPGEGRDRAVTLIVKLPHARPRFATVQVTVDPFTGRVLRKEEYSDLGPGRRARLWLRFLHTGEALGWPGQLAAGVAAVGAAVLVWTGLAMAWRRLVRRRARSPTGGRGPGTGVMLGP